MLSFENSIQQILHHLDSGIETFVESQCPKDFIIARNLSSDLLEQSYMLNESKKTMIEWLEIYQENYFQSSQLPIKIGVQINKTNPLRVFSPLKMFHIIIQNAIEAKASYIQVVVDQHQITFMDNGGGINSRDLQEIKLHRTTKFGHSGLGLKNLKSMCEARNWSALWRNTFKEEGPLGFMVKIIYK